MCDYPPEEIFRKSYSIISQLSVKTSALNMHHKISSHERAVIVQKIARIS